LLFLGGRLFMGRADPYQCVFNFSERHENRLFILGHSLLRLSLVFLFFLH